MYKIPYKAKDRQWPFLIPKSVPTLATRSRPPIGLNGSKKSESSGLYIQSTVRRILFSTFLKSAPAEALPYHLDRVHGLSNPKPNCVLLQVLARKGHITTKSIKSNYWTSLSLGRDLSPGIQTEKFLHNEIG
jgi:hypothetical protein